MAVATAMLAAETERRPPSALLPVAALFMEAGEGDRAEQLLRPHAGYDAFHAEAFARCLHAQKKPEAHGAWLAWFRMRPTAQTYAAIADVVEESDWSRLREQMKDDASSRGLVTTLVDIAVSDDDLRQLESLLPHLDATQLAHARAQVADRFSGRLSEAAVRRLEPPPVASPPTPAPRRQAAAAPPTEVSHPKFGDGRVTRVEGTGDARKYVVDFPAHGEKTILARFLTPKS